MYNASKHGFIHLSVKTVKEICLLEGNGPARVCGLTSGLNFNILLFRVRSIIPSMVQNLILTVSKRVWAESLFPGRDLQKLLSWLSHPHRDVGEE